MIHKSAGTHKEAVEFVVGIQAPDTVKEAGDYIMAARGLTAGKNDSHIELRTGGFCAFRKFDHGHSVSVGEEFPDFFLVAD